MQVAIAARDPNAFGVFLGTVESSDISVRLLLPEISLCTMLFLFSSCFVDKFIQLHLLHVETGSPTVQDYFPVFIYTVCTVIFSNALN